MHRHKVSQIIRSLALIKAQIGLVLFFQSHACVYQYTNGKIYITI